jgi:hypothetical protein
MDWMTSWAKKSVTRRDFLYFLKTKTWLPSRGVSIKLFDVSEISVNVH